MSRTYALSRWTDYNESRVPPCSKTDLAYLAGIMDGEGSFYSAHKTNTFGLVVSMTDECVIQWLVDTFGGKKYPGGQTGTWKPVYRWNLARHADLADILPRLNPYLVCKNAQAAAMLRLVEHLRSFPTYELPTKLATQSERTRRRIARVEWRETAARLRQEIRDAR